MLPPTSHAQLDFLKCRDATQPSWSGCFSYRESLNFEGVSVRLGVELRRVRLRTASSSLPGQMPQSDYFVAIFDDCPRPHVWRWEIARKSLPMGVKLGGGACRSRMAAEFAGARALKDFLVELAAQQISEARDQGRKAALEMPPRRQAS
jgi:hypothetical protein